MTDPYGDFNSQNIKKFAIIGVGGYIAKKHLEAIKSINGKVLASFDICDSVGILDSYSIDSKFFRNEADFFSFLKLNRVDYITICSPNYTHLDYIQKSLEIGSSVICEKPLVISEQDLNNVVILDSIYHKKINNILQLRVAEELIQLKNEILTSRNKDYLVDLNYITPRGDWYFKSWKNDEHKSGGILFNIGIHFFDILLWLFGKVKDFSVQLLQNNKAQGIFIFDNAKVNWFLSIDRNDLPYKNDNKPYRVLKVNNKNISLSESFSNLHSKLYQNIIDNKGLHVSDVEKSIRLILKIKEQYGLI